MAENQHPLEEVALTRYGSWTEAAMWAELLQSEGIPTVLVPLGAGAGGWGSSVMAPHEVRVRAGDVERACELLGLTSLP